jgi:hypothetical protein
MRILLLILMAAGCGKSRCEKYAEMQVRCGGNPKSEDDVTRTVSEGFCEQADTINAEFAARKRREADCAVRFLKKDTADCAGYKACKAAGPQ